jgi:hypothetical protein
MRHYYVVSYKKPKSGRLVNIAVSFPESETNGYDPVMVASRKAHDIAVKNGLPEKKYREYGLSGSLRQCVELADGSFITAEECKRHWGYVPRNFSFKSQT